MRTNQEGLDLIKEFEGLEFIAYRRAMDGIPTIGYGHTAGVRWGDTCTQEEADAWFLGDVQNAENLVLGCLGAAPVTDNQLSALVSFVFNVGGGEAGVKDGFRVLKNGQPSTMLRCLLRQDYAEAAAQFPFWAHAGGVMIPGLLTRRKAEQSLFLAGGLPDGAGNSGSEVNSGG